MYYKFISNMFYCFIVRASCLFQGAEYVKCMDNYFRARCLVFGFSFQKFAVHRLLFLWIDIRRKLCDVVFFMSFEQDMW